MASKLISVLDCVSQASMEIGIAQKPLDTLVNSLDQDIAQMGALLYAVADEVLSNEPYRTTLGDGNWLLTQDLEPIDRFTQNTDLIAFNGRLAITGVKWRFLKAKGLEFGEEMRDFTARLNKLGAFTNGEVIDLYAAEGRIQ